MSQSSSSEPLRLGIGLDGVVADFSVGWMERYNSEFGTDLHHTQVVVWDGSGRSKRARRR